MCFVEFRPGEPWKGYPNIDPETDPFVTPGSVINNLSINTVRDVDHLRDRNNGKLLISTNNKCSFFMLIDFFMLLRINATGKTLL